MKYIVVTLLFCLPLFLPGQGQKNNVDSAEAEGKASFYHDSFQGQETSNGENYDKDDFTAAHKTFPFNTYLLVTNKNNKESVVVRVNDRGPFKKSRVVDLTKSAAMKVGMVPFGVVPVKIEVMTYLDRLEVSDSIFVEDEVWDCYANKIALSEKSVFIWRTEYWKHAFYMASILALELKYDSIGVKVSGSGSNKTYIVVATGIKEKADTAKLITKLKKEGFSHARVLTDFTHK
jgi:rare lipoprotein A